MTQPPIRSCALLHLAAAAAVVAGLAGCSKPEASGPATTGFDAITTACTLPLRGTAPQSAPRPEQRCNAQAAQWAIGKTATENNVQQARGQAGAYMVRVIHQGDPALPFNPERLNLEVDATGRIVAATCG